MLLSTYIFVDKPDQGMMHEQLEILDETNHKWKECHAPYILSIAEIDDTIGTIHNVVSLFRAMSKVDGCPLFRTG